MLLGHSLVRCSWRPEVDGPWHLISPFLSSHSATKFCKPQSPDFAVLAMLSSTHKICNMPSVHPTATIALRRHDRHRCRRAGGEIQHIVPRGRRLRQ